MHAQAYACPFRQDLFYKRTSISRSLWQKSLIFRISFTQELHVQDLFEAGSLLQKSHSVVWGALLQKGPQEERHHSALSFKVLWLEKEGTS